MPTLKSRVDEDESEQPTPQDVHDLLMDTLAQFLHMSPSFGEYHLIIISALTTIMTMDVIADFDVTPLPQTGLFEIGFEMDDVFNMIHIQV